MRVGVYCGRHSAQGGGIAVYTANLLGNYLKFLSHPEHVEDVLVIYAEATILTPNFLNALENFGRAPEHAGRVTVRRLPTFLGRKAGIILDQFIVPFWTRHDRLDVLHSTANLGPLCARTTQMITVHDLFQGWPAEPPNRGGTPLALGITRASYRALFRLQFRRPYHFIVDCPSTALEIAARFGLPHSKMSVITLGVDDALEKFSAQLAEEPALHSAIRTWFQSRHITPGYTLLFASSDPRKNLKRSLEAWLELPPDLKTRGLLIRELDPKAGLMVAELLGGQADANRLYRIEWLSRQELFFVFLGAGVTLAATLAEGYGLPAVESLALACPVISSDLDCLKQQPAESIFRCNPLEIPSIRTALVRGLSASAESSAEFLDSRIQKVISGLTARSLDTLTQTASQTYALYRKFFRQAGE